MTIAGWRGRLAAAMAASWLITGVMPRAYAADATAITMWDIPESEPYTAWWKAHVAVFNAKHPDIKVTMEVFETEAYRSKIASALASGTAPDIFYLSAGPQGFRALHDGQARALDGILNKDAFTETAMAGCSSEGKLACMPLYIAPNLLFYNKAMFAKAGVDPSAWANPTQPSWAEFMAASAKLKASGTVPLALGNADSWPGTMYLWSFQNRFGGTDELAAATNGADGHTFANTPSFLKAAKEIAKLGQSGYLPLGYNGIGGGQKYALFTNAKAAIIYQGPWVLGRIATGAPKDFSFDFMAFPSLPDGLASSQHDMVGGFDALFVSAKTAHPDAVATFLNSFAEPDAAVSFMNQTQNVSVVKAALAGTAGSDGIIARMAAAVAKVPRITPWWDNYMPNAVIDASNSMIQGLFEGSVTPEAFVAGLDKAAGR